MRTSKFVVVLIAMVFIAGVSERAEAQHSGIFSTYDPSDTSPLAGYEMVGFTGGFDASYNAIERSLYAGVPDGTTDLNSPIGIGGYAGFSYIRMMPNLFVTNPSTLKEQYDPERHYRKMTTFEMRFVYRSSTGHATTSSIVDGSVVESASETNIEVAIAEPRFTFDLLPMTSQVNPGITIGGSFGHILEATISSETTGTSSDGMPQTVESGFNRRWFYSAVFIGGSMRFSLGENIGRDPAIVPEFDIVIPMTSVAAQESWLPFALRLGLSAHFGI